MVEVGLLEITIGLVVVMMGWLNLRHGQLEKRLDDKADKEDVNEMKMDVKDILNSILQLKVDMARWQGTVENQHTNKPEKS